MNIGKAIRLFRKTAGISQRGLASEVEVTPSYLCQIENGHRKPGTNLIDAVCRALSVPQEVLFWEAVDPPQDLPPNDRKACLIAKRIVREYVRTFTRKRNTSKEKPPSRSS